MYGSDYNFKAKNLTVGTHDVSYITEYVDVVNHNVSYAYFASGDSFYCISWDGQMNEEIEEMISEAKEEGTYEEMKEEIEADIKRAKYLQTISIRKTK